MSCIGVRNPRVPAARCSLGWARDDHDGANHRETAPRTSPSPPGCRWPPSPSRWCCGPRRSWRSGTSAHDFSPGALSLGRLLVGAVALGVVALTRGLRGPPARVAGLVAIGVLWFGLYNVALNAGERRVDAGTAAMLIQLSPVLVAVLAAVFLKERATPALGVGLVVAFAGVVLIAAVDLRPRRPRPARRAALPARRGVYAVSLILQKPLVAPARRRSRSPGWRARSAPSPACRSPAQLVARHRATRPRRRSGWVVYLGVFPTAIAFSTYAFALSPHERRQPSVTTYLVPPITVAAQLGVPRRGAAGDGVRRRGAVPGRRGARPAPATPRPVPRRRGAQV